MAKKRKAETAPEIESKESVTPAKEAYEYFEVIGSKKRAYLLPNDRRIDFRMGIPRDAFELYRSGFPYLGLKKGAEVLFQELDQSEIEKLIEKAPRPSDVKILKNVK